MTTNDKDNCLFPHLELEEDRVVPSDSLVREVFDTPDVMTIKPVTYGEFDPIKVIDNFLEERKEQGFI